MWFRCPPTYDDLCYPLPKPPKICIQICKSGCFRKQDFYRADDGRCVEPKECCGEYERYNAYGSMIKNL